MKRQLPSFIFEIAQISVLAAGLLAVSPGSAESLCDSDETVIFTCQLAQNHKLVSICASKKVSKDMGYLQYRYGVPGKIELIYPRSRVNTQRQFAYDYYSRAGLTSTVFDFNVGTYQYEISQSVEGDSDSGTVSAELNASSERTKKNLNLTCSVDESTSSDLSNVMDIVPHKDLFDVSR